MTTGSKNLPGADSLLPSQTGKAGDFLQTDGTNISWQPAGGGGIAIGDSIGGSTHYANLYVDSTGKLQNAFTLYNNAGDSIIDLNDRVLKWSTGMSALDFASGYMQSSDGYTSIDFQNRKLYPDANISTGTVDYGTGKLYDPSGVLAMDWSLAGQLVVPGNIGLSSTDTTIDNLGRHLIDSLGNTSVTWQAKQLYDGSTKKVDWSTGQMFNGMGSEMVNFNSARFYDALGNLSVDGDSHSLWDTGGTKTVDYDGAILKTGGIASLGWASRTLVNAFGGSVFEWACTWSDYAGAPYFDSNLGISGGIYDLYGWQSINPNSHTLYNGSGVLSVDYNNHELIDDNGYPSAYWASNYRYLTDEYGTTSLGWGTMTNGRQLVDSSSLTALDWGNREGKDNSGNATINWQYKLLGDSLTGSNSLDWGNRLLIGSTVSSGQATLDWYNYYLLADGGTHPSVDWFNRHLIKNNGGSDVTTVNWDSMSLLDASGYTAFSWSGRTFSDTSNQASADLSSRLLQIGSTAMLDWSNSNYLSSSPSTGFTRRLSGAIFTNATNATVANTTTETSLVGSPVGNVTIPASALYAGQTIRITAMGTIATTGTPTLRIKAKLGSNIIVDTAAQTLTAISGTNMWRAEFLITPNTIGNSGTVIGQGSLDYHTAVTGIAGIASASTATVTVNTNNSQAIDLTAQWGTASASNTITCTNLVCEVLN